MGSGNSKSISSDGTGEGGYSSGGGGGQLYVSVKLESFNLKPLLVPHVYGSVPVIGSWESSQALAMKRESNSTWELSFVLPENHETLDFKFLLKSKNENDPFVVEEGACRLLERGKLEEESRIALFRMNEEVLEYRVVISAVKISPFDLAISWRTFQDNLKPSTTRRIPDVSIDSAPDMETVNGSAAMLDFDLEQYEVPTPPSVISSVTYPAQLTETPSSLASQTELSEIVPHVSNDASMVSTGRYTTQHSIDEMAPYSSTEVFNSKKLGTISSSPFQFDRGLLYVDRGVGSPMLSRSASESTVSNMIRLDSKSKKAMPAASGAVAAGAIADRMIGPKENQKLAIVMVGLPARGKTFTATKLTRYLRWLGHATKHFNIGKYRRLKHGANQPADFFRADNPEGIEARNEVAKLAMEDMLSWMQEGGQVGVFDATNSSRKRRNMLMKMGEGKCKIIFLETLCNDESILERNILLKIQQSPDYAEQENTQAALQDFKSRLANYEKAYEPVEEGSYIKMIDMVSGHGGQIQVNNISGYLPGRIVFFLVNTHLTPRPILLTRHGESRDNVRGRIGGDPALSEKGELYAKKLANFLEKRLQAERTASIWTSTLQRTVLTAGPVIGIPKIQWRALDEINAGVCEGMTYEEINKNMPEEYASRKSDKLSYRYPRGESYLDVIQRLEPVMIELERQRAPLVVISHQAVLRALYGYFADKPLEEIPYIDVPLHTIIEIQMGVSGVQEKRYKLMD
ncbi:6-phosphofructo-2-kinase [Zostera marina]|uniref:6-phosphofructo-2-kinase n=1 Tax=Zostera marina TaxID=29655 RepID=A0A0K9P6F9_ZOSMR|nr:6-phosphofructo-2-kinase [Zostera marina]